MLTASVQKILNRIGRLGASSSPAPSAASGPASRLSMMIEAVEETIRPRRLIYSIGNSDQLAIEAAEGIILNAVRLGSGQAPVTDAASLAQLFNDYAKAKDALNIWAGPSQGGPGPLSIPAAELRAACKLEKPASPPRATTEPAPQPDMPVAPAADIPPTSRPAAAAPLILKAAPVTEPAPVAEPTPIPSPAPAPEPKPAAAPAKERTQPKADAAATKTRAASPQKPARASKPTAPVEVTAPAPKPAPEAAPAEPARQEALSRALPAALDLVLERLAGEAVEYLVTDAAGTVLRSKRTTGHNLLGGIAPDVASDVAKWHAAASRQLGSSIMLAARSTPMDGLSICLVRADDLVLAVILPNRHIQRLFSLANAGTAG